MTFLKVEPTVTITLDEQKYFVVSSLPQDIQKVIEYLDDWRQKELDASNAVYLYQNAGNMIKHQLQVLLTNYINAGTPNVETTKENFDDSTN